MYMYIMYICEYVYMYMYVIEHVYLYVNVYKHIHTHIYIYDMSAIAGDFLLPHAPLRRLLDPAAPNATERHTSVPHATHGRIRRRNRLKKRRKNLLSRFLEWTTTSLHILAIFPVLPNFHDCRSQAVKFFQSLSAKRNASTMARQVEWKKTCMVMLSCTPW